MEQDTGRLSTSLDGLRPGICLRRCGRPCLAKSERQELASSGPLGCPQTTTLQVCLCHKHPQETRAKAPPPLPRPPIPSPSGSPPPLPALPASASAHSSLGPTGHTSEQALGQALPLGCWPAAGHPPRRRLGTLSRLLSGTEKEPTGGQELAARTAGALRDVAGWGPSLGALTPPHFQATPAGPALSFGGCPEQGRKREVDCRCSSSDVAERVPQGAPTLSAPVKVPPR